MQRPGASPPTVDARNAQVGASVDAAIEHLGSAAYYRVPVRFDWIAGSYMMDNVVRLVNVQGTPTMLTGFGALFETPTHHQINMTNVSVESIESSPCGNGGVVVTIPVADVTSTADGQYSSTNAAVAFAGYPAKVVTAPGTELPWLCSTEVVPPSR